MPMKRQRRSGSDRSHALRGNASMDATRPDAREFLKPSQGDPERHRLYSHAERGNDHASR